MCMVYNPQKYGMLLRLKKKNVLYIMYDWIQKLRELQDQVYRDGRVEYIIFVAYWHFFH